MSLQPLPYGHPAAMGGFMGGLFGGQLDGTPPFAGSAPGPTDDRFGQPLPIPESAWPTSMRVMNQIGGLWGANSPSQSSLFGVDPSEAKRRSILAAGSAILEAAGPQSQKMNAGQIAARGMLAGQKANDEYAQDAQRRAYLAQLAQQQQMALAKAQQLAAQEAARGRMMEGVPIEPEALEKAAEKLWVAGDIAGAEGLLDHALKLRNYQVNAKNAETNASIAARGPNPYDFIEGPNGLYRVNPQTGESERVSSWAQFNPGSSTSASEVPPAEAAIVKEQLAGQLSSLIQWAEKDGGKALGSPKLGSAWDATVGRAFGTEDYQNRRAMSMITGRQLLDMAKYLKPMSNTDILFLERTMPLQDDAPELWAKWMREYAKRAQIDLKAQSSVFDKYNLDRPESQRGNAPRTGSF